MFYDVFLIDAPLKQTLIRRGRLKEGRRLFNIYLYMYTTDATFLLKKSFYSLVFGLIFLYFYKKDTNKEYCTLNFFFHSFKVQIQSSSIGQITLKNK